MARIGIDDDFLSHGLAYFKVKRFFFEKKNQKTFAH